MKKETITLGIIQNDLMKIACAKQSNQADWRYSYIVPITLLAIGAGMPLESVWVGLVVFLPSVYHIVCYVRECGEHKARTSAVRAVIERGDVSISVKTLSHIATETVYEPHSMGKRRVATKEIKVYYFKGGSSFRDLFAGNLEGHYTWSADFKMSAKGLENVSLSGDDFYYIVLQGNAEVAYIYPCKYFEVEESLRK